MPIIKEAPVFGEFPAIYSFDHAQEEFLGGFLEKHFTGTDFEELVDKESTDFSIASMGLAIDFEAYKDHSIRDLWQNLRIQEANSLRSLWMEDVAHYAHNEIIDWETTAGRCKEGSDRYIEANNEAYEWLMVARLAEHDVRSPINVALPRQDYTPWPI
mgnify:CR=1 FL=1